MYELRGESDKLEELRDANSRLREWGEWWQGQSNKFEKELNELESA